MKKTLLFLFLFLFLGTFPVFSQNICSTNPIPNYNFKLVSNGNYPDFWVKEDKVGINAGACGVTAESGALTLTTCTEYINGSTKVFSNSTSSGIFAIKGRPTALKGGLAFSPDLSDEFIPVVTIYDDCYTIIGEGNQYFSDDFVGDFNIPINYSSNAIGSFAQISFYLLPKFGGQMGSLTLSIIDNLELQGLTPSVSTVCPPPNYLHARGSMNYAYINWDAEECAEYYTLRYRKEGTTTWITKDTIPNSEYYIDTFSPCSSYEMQAKVKRKDGVSSEYCDSYYYNTQGCGGSGYPNSYGNNKTPFYLEKIEFSGFSTPTKDSFSNNKVGYWDRQFKTIYSYGTTPVVINATAKGVATNQKVYWQIWVDLNENHAFETNELVIKKTTTGSEALQNANFVILPPNTYGHNRMLRVQLSGTPDIKANETNFIGQTLDYYLNLASNPCEYATNLYAEPTSNSNVTLSWWHKADSVRIRPIGTQKWDVFWVSQFSYQIKLIGNLPCTNYEFQMITKCGTSTKQSDDYNFRMPGCNGYCPVVGWQADYIKSISLNDLSVTNTKNEGYTDNLNCTKVEKGKTYTFNANAGFPSGTTTKAEYWRVYIDYNEDKDFDDTNELVYDSGTAVLGSVTASITIPNSTTYGIKKMRIGMKRTSATDTQPPTSCGEFVYGEVRDYRIMVAPPVIVAPSKPTITIVGSTTFCEGGNVILKAPDGFDYLWSNSATSQTVIITKSGNYSVVVKDKVSGLSSPNSEQIVITVNPKPTLTVTGNLGVCKGGFTSLNAIGTGNFVWNTGALGSSLFLPNLTISTTYSVTLTDFKQCTSTQMVEVKVFPLPQIKATTNPITEACDKSIIQLSASGGLSYKWAGTGLQQTIGNNISTTILYGTNYFEVEGTDINGCINKSNVTIFGNPIPQVNVFANNLNPCVGDNITLTAFGADSYVWSSTLEGGLIGNVGNNILAKPSKEGKISYSAVGTSTKGCKSLNAVLDINVKNCGVATNDTDAENDIVVYPNPFSDRIFFTNPERIEEIEIFDVLGKSVYQQKNISNGVDLEILANELYLVKIRTFDKNMITRKVTKIE